MKKQWFRTVDWNAFVIGTVVRRGWWFVMLGPFTIGRGYPMDEENQCPRCHGVGYLSFSDPDRIPAP